MLIQIFCWPRGHLIDSSPFLSFWLPMVSIFILYFFPLLCLYPKCLNWIEHLRTGIVSDFKRGYNSKTPCHIGLQSIQKVWGWRNGLAWKACPQTWWTEFDPQIHILKGENQIIQLVFSVWRISCTKTYILRLFSVSFLIFAISETNTVMLFFSPSDFFRKIRESELFVLSIFYIIAH